MGQCDPVNAKPISGGCGSNRGRSEMSDIRRVDRVESVFRNSLIKRKKAEINCEDHRRGQERLNLNLGKRSDGTAIAEGRGAVSEPESSDLDWER